MWKREDWAHLFVCEQPGEEPWWQSPVHIRFQYELAMACWPRLTRVLEVGSYLGTSASAYVQAILDGANLFLDCCDTHITESLRETLARVGGRAHPLQMRGVDAIGRGYDLVILDSDHRIECTSRELGLCLAHEIDTIILHDTHATWVEWCAGAVWARKALECHPAYQCISDALMQTDNKRRWGLTVATRIPEVYQAAKQLMGQL